jgi:DnaJ-class molecular chaperone
LLPSGKPDAPPEVIKAAYKALAKIHHLDLRGNNEKMLEINRAFDVITQNR